MSEKRHTVNESADKITLKTSWNRGSDTRDQDKIDVKIKGDDPVQAAKKLRDTLHWLEKENVAKTLRNTQPENNE